MKRKISSLLGSAVLVLMASNVSIVQSADQLVSNVTKKQLKTREATAKTPEDYRKLAKLYRDYAAQQRVESRKHAEIAAKFAKNPLMSSTKFYTTTVGHHEYWAKSSKTAAEKAEAKAAVHEREAGE